MKLRFPGHGPAPLIGVDVSSSAVKMLELGDNGKGVRRVERYAIAPLPKEAIVDGIMTKPELVESAMLDAWRKLNTKTRHIAMALPSSAVITKRFLLPAAASETDIEALVSNEASQLVSFPSDDVSFDYQVLGINSKHTGQNDALLVATRKERVEERVAAAEAAGLKPVIMDVDTFAALTAYEQIAFPLPDKGRNQTVAIIDIGAQTTHFNVLHDNQPIYQREHTIGGHKLTSDIARVFNMQTEEAENAKRKSLLPPRYESEVYQPFLDSLVLEINRALQMFFTATPYQRIDHILLAGGCAALPGLDEAVNDKTRTATTIANPFAKMALSFDIKARDFFATSPALLVACGLALRRFDNA